MPKIMSVADLVAALSKLPQDAAVKGVYDGAARTEVGDVWLSRGGYVCLAEHDGYVYYEEDFPPGDEHPNIERRL